MKFLGRVNGLDPNLFFAVSGELEKNVQVVLLSGGTLYNQLTEGSKANLEVVLEGRWFKAINKR